MTITSTNRGSSEVVRMAGMEPEPSALDCNTPRGRSKPLFRWFVMYPLLGLLAVVLLLSVVISSCEHLKGQRRDLIVNTLADLANVHSGLDKFAIDTGRYPTTTGGIDALLIQPIGVGGWQGPYIEGEPRDAWGRHFIYRCPGIQHPASFDLLSVGPDGIEGTDDDLRYDGFEPTAKPGESKP